MAGLQGNIFFSGAEKTHVSGDLFVDIGIEKTSAEAEAFRLDYLLPLS